MFVLLLFRLLWNDFLSLEFGEHHNNSTLSHSCGVVCPPPQLVKAKVVSIRCHNFYIVFDPYHNHFWFYLVLTHYIWLQVCLLPFCLKIAVGIWEFSWFMFGESLKLVISYKCIAVCKYHYNKYWNTPYITKISHFLPMAHSVGVVVSTTTYST